MFKSTSPRRDKYSSCVRSCLIIMSVNLTGELATSRADVSFPVPPLSASRFFAAIEGREAPFEKLEGRIDVSSSCGSTLGRGGSFEADCIEESLAVVAGSAWDIDRFVFSFWKAASSADGLVAPRCSSPNSVSSLSMHTFLSAAELSPHDDFPDPILLRLPRAITKSVTWQILVDFLFRPPKSQNPL